MNVGRAAGFVAGAAVAGAVTAVAAPTVVDALTGADAPPEPAPAPAPVVDEAPSAPQADAVRGAEDVEPSATEPEPEPAPEPEPVRTYQNPVFASNAPDPAVLRADDGRWYAYTTETDGLPFQVLRSDDLVHWKRVGAAFDGNGPSWIDENRWAPDVKKTGDHYTMLYSGRGDDGRMRIGYATSKQPQGPFHDRGVLVEGDSYGYFIDPNLTRTSDGWKLLYGSTGGDSPADQSGIAEVDVKIDGDGDMHVTSKPHVVVSEEGERYLVEGAWMHQRGDWWYLFYSDGRYDAKGGKDDYALNVARAKSPDGPFEKLGTPILGKGNGFTGPGHNSIATDDSGRDWVVYHAWGSDPAKGRMLLVDPIEWKDGWPVVNGGKGPSSGKQVAPAVDG